MSYAFPLDDFRAHLERIRQEGIENVISRMPTTVPLIAPALDPEVALKRVQGMIDAMTKKERRDPDIIDAGRRRRIAAGAGVQPHEVTQFLKQLKTFQTIRRRMMSVSVWQRVLCLFGFRRFRPPPPPS